MIATPVQERVRTRLGEVAYVRAGRGPSLLLLHGNGHSWHEFATAFDALAARWDVIAWDMPGHGDSDDVTASPSIEAYAGSLADLIAALGLRRPAVLGSSVGAFIAASHAAGGGEVSAVVLEEMQFRTRDWWLAAWPRVEQMFGQTEQPLEAVQPRFIREVDAEFLDRWNRERVRTGAAGMVGVMAAIRDFDLAGALAKLDLPCLLLFGAEGPTVDRAEALAAALAGSTAAVVPEAGHFISLDQPAAFAAAVTHFLLDHMETIPP
jgi:pimeloyl-ACP methyl ester carboxylesterase